MKHPSRRDRHADTGQYRFSFGFIVIRKEIPVNTNVQGPEKAPFVSSMRTLKARVADTVAVAEIIRDAWTVSRGKICRGAEYHAKARQTYADALQPDRIEAALDPVTAQPRYGRPGPGPK